MQLLRIRGSTVQAGLAATSTPASVSATSSTNGTSSAQGLSSTGELDGEGEGEGLRSSLLPSKPHRRAVRCRSVGKWLHSDRNQPSSQRPLRNHHHASYSAVVGDPSPRMTASDVADRVDTTLTSTAVDEAIRSVLPSMQLQLADDLSDTLARRH
ncbi:MAG: hypothetical protein R3C56_04265 [Pirellulaceae bacterium]